MPQWLQYDLGDLHTLSRVEQSFANPGTWRFKIEGSVDGTNWATLVDRTAGAAGQVFSESVNGTFRYVKLTVTGSREGFTASSREFRVFGSNEGYNIAAGRPVSASTSLAGYEPGGAADANTSTYWVASSGTLPQWLKVDLGGPSLVTGVEQNFKDADTYKFKIEGSLDNTNWTLLMDRSLGASGQSFKQAVSGAYRYVRLTVSGSGSQRPDVGTGCQRQLPLRPAHRALLRRRALGGQPGAQGVRNPPRAEPGPGGLGHHLVPRAGL